MKNYNYKRQGFLLVSVVAMYTILALIELLITYTSYSDIIVNNVDAINAINNVRTSMNSIDSTILGAVYSQDTKSDEMVITKAIEECERNLQLYSNTKISEAEEQALADFNSYFRDYKTKVVQISTSIGLGNIDTAEQYYADGIKSKRDKYNSSLDTLKKLAESNKSKSLNSIENRGKITGVVTILLSVMISIILLYFNKRQENAEKELIENNKTIEKQKGTINTAVFNDVLTDAHNRMSFINSFSKGKKEISENESYYFAMFDIDDFSAANVEYGTPSGDMILNSTASVLKNHFETPNVFRTGSDEFVVVFKTESDAEGYRKFLDTLEKARLELAKPHKIKNGSLVVTYSISAVKKSAPGNIDSTVLGPLKRSLDQARIQQPGNVIFTDLDFGKA